MVSALSPTGNFGQVSILWTSSSKPLQLLVTCQGNKMSTSEKNIWRIQIIWYGGPIMSELYSTTKSSGIGAC